MKPYYGFITNRKGRSILNLDRNKIDIAIANAGIPSYRQLAQRIGCSAQNLSVILNRGSCKPATVGKIAAALGVPVESMVKETDPNA